MINPSVAIIILNWNGLQYTRNCLYSLNKVKYQPLHIIVIDNGSQNNEAEQLKNEFKQNITIICQPKNFGFAEGSNIGIRWAIKKKFDYICLLNNDTTVDPKFLDHLVKAAESDKTIAMVAPSMRSIKNPSEIDNLGITLTLSGLAFNRKNDSWRMFCPSGGAVLYRSSSLKAIEDNNSYFDPLYFAYVEDLDLGFRLLWQGYKSKYTPQAIIFHHGSASTAPMSDFGLYHSQRNLLLTWFKNLPFIFLLKYGFLMIIVQIAYSFLFIKRHKFFIMLKADFAALKLFPLYFYKRKFVQKSRKINSKTLMVSIEPKIVMTVFLRKVFRP